MRAGLLEGCDESMKINVLKAGSTLSESSDPRFTLAVLNLSEDSSADVRQTVRYVYEGGQRGILYLDASAKPDPNLVGKVLEILKSGNPDSQALVLPMLAGLPSNSLWKQQSDVQDALRSMLYLTPRPKNYDQILQAASSFDGLMDDSKIQEQVLAGLNSYNPAAARRLGNLS